MSAGVDPKALQGEFLLLLLNVEVRPSWWVQVVIGCEGEVFHPSSPPYSKVPSVAVISAGVYSNLKTMDQL